MTKLFIATLLAFTVTPALAEPAPIAVSTVQTADLDLSNAAGQRALDQRIARAAFEVCGTASNVDLEGKNAVRQCRDETIAKAGVQREQLLAAARLGKPIAIAAR